MGKFLWAAAAVIIAGALGVFLLYKPAENAPAPIVSPAGLSTTAAPEPAAAEGAKADPAQAQGGPATPAPTAAADQGKPSGKKAKTKANSTDHKAKGAAQ